MIIAFLYFFIKVVHESEALSNVTFSKINFQKPVLLDIKNMGNVKCFSEIRLLIFRKLHMYFFDDIGDICLLPAKLGLRYFL